MRALVTGGAGFIGSHLSTALLDLGHHVRILDDLSTGNESFIDERAEFIKGSVVDKHSCEAATEDVSHVFHLAAMSRSGPSMHALDDCVEANVVGTSRLLQASEIAGVERLVFSASSTCYGNSATPHHLDSPIDLLNPYGWSKYAAEQMALMFDRNNSLDVVSLRYFNVYGPREPQSGPYALVLGIFIDRWANDLSLEIHGSGEQSRDFVYVGDVVRCNILAATAACHGVHLNVGSGKAVSVKQLADMVSTDQVHVPRRSGDSDATLADIAETERLLGWKPQVSLEEGVRQAKALRRSKF